MTNSIFQALAEAAPSTYLKESSSGQTILRDLFQRCASGNLVPAAAVDDIARLHCIFDVALEHGMGHLVHDYLVEVCFDRSLTSNDPVESFLLDGECVRRWCQKTLSVTRQRLTGWLGRGIAFISSSGVLPREVGKLRMLQLVVEALAPADLEGDGSARQQRQQRGQRQQQAGRHGTAPASFLPAPPGTASPLEESVDELVEVQRLLQCAEVVAWLCTRPVLQSQPSGRFASEQEWRGTVAKRRDGAAPASLFLADLTADLATHGVKAPPYPPPNLERMLQALFLSGGSTPAAWQAKLALLMYYLADGGFVVAMDVATSLKAPFAIPPSLSVCWMLQLFLDDAQMAATPNTSLVQAANFLPGIDGASAPFKVLQVFLALDRPDIALGLLRQRDSSGNGTLEEASAALRVRLANGLLAEAFLEAKRFLDAGPPEQRAQRADRLLGELLEWGVGAGGLHGIIRLPFAGGEEEAAVVGWLKSSAENVPQAGLMLTLYYLMRGRTPEALHAFGTLCPPLEDDGGKLEGLRGQVRDLLHAAAGTLPAAQRALVVQSGGRPSLQVTEDAQADGMAEGTVLVAAVGGLEFTGLPSVIVAGPSLAHTPLVGSVVDLAAASGDALRNAACCVPAEQTRTQSPQGAGPSRPTPAAAPLFGGAAGDASRVAVAADVRLFGTPVPAGGVAPGGGHRHELDRLLGLPPAAAKR